MTDNCVKCDKQLLIREPSYPGQSEPTLCDECFNITYPNFLKKYARILGQYSNERIRNTVRLRPDGQCYNCGKVKTELMEDPNDPTKIYERMYIWCNECEKEIEEKYGVNYKYQY